MSTTASIEERLPTCPPSALSTDIPQFSSISTDSLLSATPSGPRYCATPCISPYSRMDSNKRSIVAGAPSTNLPNSLPSCGNAIASAQPPTASSSSMTIAAAAGRGSEPRGVRMRSSNTTSGRSANASTTANPTSMSTSRRAHSTQTDAANRTVTMGPVMLSRVGRGVAGSLIPVPVPRASPHPAPWHRPRPRCSGCGHRAGRGSDAPSSSPRARAAADPW